MLTLNWIRVKQLNTAFDHQNHNSSSKTKMVTDIWLKKC